MAAQDGTERYLRCGRHYSLSISEIAPRERCLYNYQPTAEKQRIVFRYAAEARDLSPSAASLPTLDPQNSMGVAGSLRGGKRPDLETHHLTPSDVEVSMIGGVFYLPLYAFMAFAGTVLTDTLTFMQLTLIWKGYLW